MTAWLQPCADIAVPIFVVTSMAAAGLRLRGAEMVGMFRSPPVLVGALAANFVAAPAYAYVIVRLFSLQSDHGVGLILLGCAAGAPFLPKLVEFAGGDVAGAVGLMLLLMLVSLVTMPLTLPLLIPGLSANAWQIGRPLLLTMFVPLVVGLLVRQFSPASAKSAEPAVARIANFSLAAAVLLLVLANMRAMVDTVGSGLSAATVLFVVGTFAIGYALAGGSPGARIASALGAGQRNVAAALVIASAEFPGPGVAMAVITATFAGLVPLVLVSVLWRRSQLPTKPPTTLGESS